ncbi:MAG: hypothetical protein IPP52_14030 [Ignavibacteria bacterium]|nr:hypothetical protein [Ignavibacteria bacterium]
MNQFKDVINSGTGSREYSRAADTRNASERAESPTTLKKSERTVTIILFFEMPGNWSFEDYYKRSY